MNVFKKIYCRLYQSVFYLLMPLLPYKKPKIYEDNSKVIDILKDKKINSILIVTDKGIVQNGILDEIILLLNENNINFTIYDKTIPNPTISNVEEAREQYINNNHQGIVAVGGGSPIDLAKIVGARISKPQQSVSKMKGLLHINKKLPLLIAVPTTAGTGSETTVTAVITDDKTHHKYPINDFCLIPLYAILDYKNTLKLPKHITSTTGMDALTHAVEAYIGRSTTKETRTMALTAIKLIVENILTSYNEPSNIEARKNMLLASHYAGIAFTKSYVGYVHAVAHTLGGKYQVPHGKANAIILPYVLEIYGKSVSKKLAEIARICNISTDKDNQKAAEEFINWIKNVNEQMNISNKIDELLADDIDELSVLASKEANPLYPVPRLMDKNELKTIYNKLIK